MSLEIIHSSPSSVPVRDLYTRMLLTRVVDHHLALLHRQGLGEQVAPCGGHEAAQVGSASCIDIAQDVTLPYQRDLGVFLTLGMTPYEAFQTHLIRTSQSKLATVPLDGREKLNGKHYFNYQKHNIVTGPSSVAMQVLHAAGIAFANTLRRSRGVTIAYCDESTLTEADFREAITFAALHKLPILFICEHNYSQGRPTARPVLAAVQQAALPIGLEHRYLDGADVLSVYATMQAALRYAREGHGPVLLEMHVTRPSSGRSDLSACSSETLAEQMLTDSRTDPLLRCRQLLSEQGLWDQQWADLLYQRLMAEVEQAMHDATSHLSLSEVLGNPDKKLFTRDR
ncbi:MAG TPA: thiamine pyrophosphate-dependent enzyme [Ktedonobacteraceae bacterium]|nr:thiamine pyrophosphate-dependent enzyme [Ktedonobacteraceae bacterium]